MHNQGHQPYIVPTQPIVNVSYRRRDLRLRIMLLLSLCLIGYGVYCLASISPEARAQFFEIFLNPGLALRF